MRARSRLTARCLPSEPAARRPSPACALYGRLSHPWLPPSPHGRRLGRDHRVHRHPIRRRRRHRDRRRPSRLRPVHLPGGPCLILVFLGAVVLSSPDRRRARVSLPRPPQRQSGGTARGRAFACVLAGERVNVSCARASCAPLQGPGRMEPAAVCASLGPLSLDPRRSDPRRSAPRSLGPLLRPVSACSVRVWDPACRRDPGSCIRLIWCLISA